MHDFYNTDKLLSSYLSSIDIHELMDKIQRFRTLNIKKLTDIDLASEIENVICFKDSSGNRRAVLTPFFTVYKKGTLLYRVRKINNALDTYPINEIKTRRDLWNPPNKYVKRGRLNKPHESLLYVCPNALTAIDETHVVENESFVLIIYEINEDIKANCIGIHDNFKNFPPDDRLKLRMLRDFLKDEFTRDVGIGTEHLYRTSEIIAKGFFDLPPRAMQDAWCYPSVALKPSVNLCLRPEVAFDTLRLKGAQIISGYNVISDDCIEFEVKAIVVEAIDGTLQYHSIGSEMQRKIFPEIS